MEPYDTYYWQLVEKNASAKCLINGKFSCLSSLELNIWISFIFLNKHLSLLFLTDTDIMDKCRAMAVRDEWNTFLRVRGHMGPLAEEEKKK